MPHYHHPYHIIPSDCLHLILHYYVFSLGMVLGMNEDEDNNNDMILIQQQQHLVEPSSSSSSLTTTPKHPIIKMHPRDKNWQFLQKYAHCLSMPFHKSPHHCTQDSPYSPQINKFLNYCRHLEEKQTFYYLELSHLHLLDSELLRGVQMICHHGHHEGHYIMPSPDAFEEENRICQKMGHLFGNMRGIRSLEIDMGGYQRIPVASSFQHLRGIRRLIIHNYDFLDLSYREIFSDNCRGLHHLGLLNCEIPDNYPLFLHLRGIKSLTIEKCTLLGCKFDFWNLRGIERLRIQDYDFILTDQIATHLRGIQELDIWTRFPPDEKDHSLTNVALENLRGIRKLALSMPPESGSLINITTSGFMNLRGIQSLTLRHIPKITSGIFEHLRGIRALRIESCPDIDFSAQTLQNLRGIQSLTWYAWDESEEQDIYPHGQEKYLTEQCLRQLYGVEILRLDVVVAQSNQAFRHLSQATELYLYGNVRWEHDRFGDEGIALGDAAFSHLKQVQRLHVESMKLKVSSFSRLVKENMPQLQSCTIQDCLLLRSSLEATQDGEEAIEAIIHEYGKEWVYASFSIRRIIDGNGDVHCVSYSK